MSWVMVDDRMQRGYSYQRVCAMGEGFDAAFTPALTPRQMLEYGVFEGVYMNDCRAEFPAEWFAGARLSARPDPDVNYFGVKSRQPLSVWREKGWIHGPDPRGWFQWYCRYYSGRRLPEIDTLQIRRWRAFNRHAGQIRANCHPGDLFCRPRQRQALLQWAWDPFI
ncbi:hypothetical protein [Shimia sp.]|uniref:hypothetical protein n=1 Tax=Shimia sp. TaxID=1954381 RepID=UPI003561CDE6